MSTPHLRTATVDDLPALRRLIEASVRALSTESYEPDLIERALQDVLGIDTQLILDGTYYVIDSGGTIVAAGGWGARQNPHGGDQAKQGADALLDPVSDAAGSAAVLSPGIRIRREG